MTQRRAQDLGMRDVQYTIYTPEEAPLIVFGTVASESVSELMRARGIEVHPRARVHEDENGELVTAPGGKRLDASHVVALPTLEGPAIPGAPADEGGFLPIDEHARVKGAEDLYAAGDGTNFPIKQGGLGTQQADAAAEHIAARYGADIEPRPFHPVLRGMLLTGEESLSLADRRRGRGRSVERLPVVAAAQGERPLPRRLARRRDRPPRPRAALPPDGGRGLPAEGVASRADGARPVRAAAGLIASV